MNLFNCFQDSELANKVTALLNLFSYEGKTAHEIIYDLTSCEHETIADKADEVFNMFFSDDPEDYLYLEERIDDDPELARIVQDEMDKNPVPIPGRADVFPFGFAPHPK